MINQKMNIKTKNDCTKYSLDITKVCAKNQSESCKNQTRPTKVGKRMLSDGEHDPIPTG